jgi:putative GTP pyrophosphokinase
MDKKKKVDELETLRQAYGESHGRYERFCSGLVIQLEELIASEGVTTAFPIQSRVKTWESIERKCERYGWTPKTLGDIPDVAGLRIVLLFERDLRLVSRVIEDNLDIIRREDTRDRLGVGEFGYGSIHYEVAAPDSWLKVPTLRALAGLHGEVQVRTASQHIWAEASHILQYKKETDVPPTLRRSINRAAALLEVVDLEFERVLSVREEYLAAAPMAPEGVLNSDSLRIILDEMWPKENKDAIENYSELLEDLKHFNFGTAEQLRKLIIDHRDDALQEDQRLVATKQKDLNDGREPFGTTKERMSKGVYLTHLGLTRTAIEKELGTDFTAYLRERYKET